MPNIPISVQLYTLRTLTETDFPAALKQVVSIVGLNPLYQSVPRSMQLALKLRFLKQLAAVDARIEDQATQHTEKHHPVSTLVELSECWHFLTFCHSNLFF